MIIGIEINWKDWLALLAILGSISDSSSLQLNIKKSTKKNWEVLWIIHVGADHVIQLRVQERWHEFENLA